MPVYPSKTLKDIAKNPNNRISVASAVDKEINGKMAARIMNNKKAIFLLE